MSVSLTHPQADIRRLVVGPAPVLAADATVREAAMALRALNASAALIDGPDQIVTERDLTKAWSHGLTGDEPVSRIATRDPIVVGPDTAVVDAAALMLNREIRHLIVVDGNTVGIVSLRTILAVLLQAVQPELWLSALQVSITEVPERWIG
jgi:signal-transduction protein with cAMP-binding, CBS, and nucleotidyltransferase domain